MTRQDSAITALFAVALAAACSSSGGASTTAGSGGAGAGPETSTHANAKYINNTLLAMGAHAEKYMNAPGIHPSEPNYLWLEAGTNFGILDDKLPATNHQSTKEHLVTLLEAAGKDWRSYQEDIKGDVCPLTNVGAYAPKHNAMVFFDDVINYDPATKKADPMAPRCLKHVRPYGELATDLANHTVTEYSFITPNLCDDMHDTCSASAIQQGDDWLAAEVPKILASDAYKQDGALFITWDESEGPMDYPIGMIVLSPFAKVGYSNSIAYTHGSALRTFEEIFDLSPMLGDAANQTDLSDLFTSFP
jgi:hypothetical protein